MDGATAPQRAPPESSAEPPLACLQCRKQKLRYHRERPSCRRCCKQRRACSYPSPPDRKLIAQKSSQARASALASAAPLSTSTAAAPANPGKRQRLSDNIKEHPEDDSHEAAKLPSTEVGLLLLEIYFKRVHNATLLFHKGVAFQLYRQDAIPAYLIRAIFAHAAIFLEQIDSPYTKHIKILPIHTLFENSWLWARSASQEALSHADEPTLVRIQALQVLQSYYVSRGEIQRAIVHASLAYRLSQLLGYDRLYEDIAPNRSLQFDHEMKRRCFWDSWCSSCSIGGEQWDSSGLCDRVAGLPVPADFVKGGSVHGGVDLNMGQKMEVDWKTSHGSLTSNHGTIVSSYSLMAEMVRLLGVWRKVQRFSPDSPTLSRSQRTSQLNELMELLDHIEQSLQLPPIDLCSRAESYDESPELLTSVCSMYYMSRLLMHASMVPSLLGRPLQPTASPESVQKHLDMALQQAFGLVELLKQFVANDLDMTRLWHFTGCGAFLAGSVFLVCKSTMQSAQVSGPGLEDFTTIQTVLNVLSIYWKPLRTFAIKLNNAIEYGRYNAQNSIALFTYPWDACRSSYDRGSGAGVWNCANPVGPLIEATCCNPLSDGQLDHDLDRHEKNTYSYRELSEISSQENTAAEIAIPYTPESRYPTALEDSLLCSNNEALIYEDWWNESTSLQGYTPLLAEVPSTWQPMQ